MNLIAVHAGAGYHSEANKEAYFQVCRAACQAGLESFSSSCSPLDAVVAAIAVLEDSPLTNAGTGSNLSVDGTVECDASLMLGSSTRWAGVGCLSGIKNPIKVAKGIFDLQGEQQPCGLVPPSLMVGSGAKKFALDRNLSKEANLVTEKSLQSLRRYTERVEQTMNKKSKSMIEVNQDSVNGFQADSCDDHTNLRKDTVGAIAISCDGITAAGLSSGGLLLKTPGRVGQAASYGAGCWAQEGVTLTTSGVGEYLVKSLLASRLACDLERAAQSEDTILVDSLNQSLNNNFSKSCSLLKEFDPKDLVAGVLGAVVNPDTSNVEVFCSHSSASMIFAFQSSEMSAPETHLSRLPADCDHFFRTNVFMLSPQPSEQDGQDLP